MPIKPLKTSYWSSLDTISPLTSFYNFKIYIHHMRYMENGGSVAQACPTLCNPMDCSMPGFLVLHHLWVSSNLCPLNQWCHPAISPSVIPFFSWLQSFPASGSFLMSWLFASGGQSTGASASASVLPMNIQGWFPLALTDLISFQSKGLSRVFFSTLVQKYQFFGTQLYKNWLKAQHAEN